MGSRVPVTPAVAAPSWTLHKGDALRVLTELPSDSCDALISDPPYSSGGMYRGDRMLSTEEKYVCTGVKLERSDFAGDTRDSRSFGYWCSLWLAEALRVCRDGAPVALFIDWRQLPQLTDALQAGGWLWRGIAVWDKTLGVRPAMSRYRQQAEFIVWGSKGAMPKVPGVPALPGVFINSRDDAARLHQTGKPVELMRKVIGIVKPGGVILDPFTGSGSTGIAALQTGQSFVGCEVTDAWHDVASRRLAAVAAGGSDAEAAAAE